MTKNEFDAAHALLASLREKGVEIWLDGKNIRYVSKIGAIDEADRAQIISHSRGLASLLSTTEGQPPDLYNEPILLSDGISPPLFCIHSVSGAATLYRRLNMHESDSPAPAVYGVNARGRDLSTPPHSTVEEMADAYIRAIKAIQPQGPYQLCGYSMGGMVAFEMASRLRTDGDKIAFLGLIDTGYNSGVRFDNLDFWVTFANIYTDTPVEALFKLLADTDGQSKEAIAYALFRIAENGPSAGTGSRKSINVFQKELTFFEALYNASMTYVAPKTNLDLTYFGFVGGNNAEGWATRVRKLHLVTIPGDHLGLFKSAATASQVGKELLRAIDRYRTADFTK